MPRGGVFDHHISCLLLALVNPAATSTIYIITTVTYASLRLQDEEMNIQDKSCGISTNNNSNACILKQLKFFPQVFIISEWSTLHSNIFGNIRPLNVLHG